MYEDKLDKITWSFSSVNTYHTCPRSFKLSYIDDVKPKISNAFAEFGIFVHKLLERYFKGEAEFIELSQMYENEYDINVLHEFPPYQFCNLSEKYYDDGLKYLNSFNGIDDKYKIVGIEKKFKMTINDRPFTGIIDLILQDQTDGKYVIVDHKSKSRFKNKKEKEHYLIQLYLYSAYIKETFGEYQKELKFNMFRTQTLITEKFQEEKFKQAVSWFDFTIDLIYFDSEFPKNPDEFYCENLCDVREFCSKEGD